MSQALLNARNGVESKSQESVIAAKSNEALNRYSDVLPYDRNRVKLRGEMDYINASHIVSPFGKRWIAPQGPLPHTALHFWDMVWQQTCTTIVMLTKTVENGRIKCHEYWPSDSLVGNGWTLRLVSTQKHSDMALITRTFEMYNSDEKRTITQLHYLGWPDHGVPDSPKDLFQLLDMLDASEPAIVHCSAGVGRTGTLITIDTLRQCKPEVWEDGDVIFDIVSHYRRQRTLMVQSFEQYYFLYQACGSLVK